MMRRHRQLIACILGFVGFFIAGTIVRAQTAEEITTFAADITVAQSGDVSVVERIEYVFPSERHGIFRDIPTRYEDDMGNGYRVPVTVTGVSMDGASVPYVLQRSRAAVRIKIGDPNRTISGSHVYVVSYAVSGALRRFEDHDELYWNVTGNEWAVPIRRVQAVVRLPSTVPGDRIIVRCFTGGFGSTAQECVANVMGAAAQFAANGPLTVVTGWPQGYVTVSAPKRSWSDYYGPLLPFALPLITLVGLLWFWWTRGRDPEGRGTIVVQYEPPDELRPAEVGVLVDEKAQLKDISAVIVDLAVRGYLKIREIQTKGFFLTSTDYEFERLANGGDGPELRVYENDVLRTLFSYGRKTVRVSQLKDQHEFYDDLPGIRKNLYGEMVTLGYFPSSPAATRNLFIGIGIATVFVGWALTATVFSSFGDGAATTGMVSSVLSGFFFIVFAPFMPRKTLKGSHALEHAWGFREYLERAEKYRIEWQEKEKVFERFLPYAMVFGVADKWAKAFEPLGIKPPDWYEGSAIRSGVFNAAIFSSALKSMDSSMMTAMRSAPQQTSSGSGFGGGGGGGGFSGGGFGGGGGGSW